MMTKTETDTETMKKEGLSSESFMKVGYKKTKLGWIPEDWNISSVGNYLDFIGGNAFKSDDSTEEGVRWLKIANVGIQKIIWEDESYLPSDFSNRFEKYLLSEGDVVMALTRPILNNRLKIARLDRIDSGALLNQRVGKLLPKENSSLRYFYYLFQTNYVVHRMEVAMAGTDPPNIGFSDLRKIKISVPPRPEQKKIAEILSTWDRAIETLEQLIAKKKELKKGLMQQLLSGEKRFPGFEGKWREMKAGKLFDFLRSISVSRKDLDENYSEESVLNLHYGDLHVKYNSMTMLDVGNSNDIPSIVNGYNYPSNIDYAKDGDVIIVDASEDYEGVGECVELKNVGEKKLTAGLHTFLLRDKLYLTVEGFRSLIFEQPKVKQQLKRLVTGSNVFGLSKSNLAKVEVDLPSKEEQRKIVETLQGIESEIGSLKIMRDTFEVQKKGLMQQLLTGKIRVKNERKN